MPILGRIDSEKAVHFSTVHRLVCRDTIANLFIFRNRLKTNQKRVDCTHITITIMATLKSRDKAILEKIFQMGGGYVLDFSDRTMEAFFAEDFDIEVYDKKYDFDFQSNSKANRMRGIWLAESDPKVGSIILALIDYAETTRLTRGVETTPVEKELFQKGKDIGLQMLLGALGLGDNPEVVDLKNKATIIKEFNVFDFSSLDANARVALLKVLFSYYEASLTTYYGQGLFFLTSGIDDLNDYFKVLRKRVRELVASDATFEDMQKSSSFTEIFDPITSLYTTTDFLDVAWEDSLKPALVHIREDIADKDLFENNCEMYKYGSAVNDFLEAMAKEISNLKTFLDRKTENFYKEELPKHKEAFEKTNQIPEKETVIKHEHTHRFENNIQEKDIVLNHKYEKDTPSTFYITKKGEDFHYKGRYINISKTAEYYKVFCALFAKLPEGGEIVYKDLISEIKSRIPTRANDTSGVMKKFIQRNLTDKSNGFMRYAGIPETEDSGKPLISVSRGRGIIFNNKTG